ncbi:MAG: immunoglobulin domain-containing protein [Clostridiales bacterium]|nr:immunoglobulin domain-containing protein [Clostridiales bacterium]
MKLTQKFTHKFVLFALLICFALTQLLFGGVFAGFSTQNAFAAEPNAVEELPLNDSDIPHFFYNQLGNEQKAFYEAMEEMYKSGKFARGEDFDLTDGTREYVSQQQLKAYANGDQTILKVLGGARDAFYTDYDDIFYVDFGYLSLRVTQDSNSRYHAYLGSGRADTYYVQGFDSEASVNAAKAEYQAELNKIVSTANSAQPTEDQVNGLGEALAAQVAKIQEAHKQIALATVYKLESTCTPGNEGHIRTAYGVFVKGQALCEGYSRAFKAVMDELGYPCVLINGGYRHTTTQTEEHMWTYVKLVDGNWYAVDQTFDDINGKIWKYGANEVLAEYNEDYFLKGAAFMDAHHVPSEYKSAAEYPFRYPTLSEQNLGAEITNAYGYFHIVQTPHDGKAESTDIQVSVWVENVGWCSYARAAEHGYYILMRHEGNYLPDKLNNNQYVNAPSQKGEDWVIDFGQNVDDVPKDMTHLVWGYLNSVPGTYPIEDIDNPDGSSYTLIRDEGKATGFEFAVTTIAPFEYDEDHKFEYTDPDVIAQMFTYCGDMAALTARSGLIATKYNAYKDEQPAPFIVRATPATGGKIQVGQTYHIKVEYDQYLALENGYEQIVASVYGVRATGEILKGTNTVPASVISNIKWYSGKRNENGFGMEELGWISFDFTPTKYFAHDNILYMFDFNIVGEATGKRVNTVSYAVANKTSYCSLGVYGYNWNIFGQPQLLEDSDLSRNGWVDSNGNSVTNVKDRMSLVVTSPTAKQDETMNNMIYKELGEMPRQDTDDDGNYSGTEGKVDEGKFQSFTYNIQLAICRACIINTGEGVRVSIGFPDGFNYESWMSGVTFKMYHFIHDDHDNIIGVEEIPVTVTKLGLIIVIKSFSPFALVAVQGEARSEEEIASAAEKTVIISASNGGTAFVPVEELDKETNTAKIVDSKLFSMNKDDKRELTVVANDGYVIESIKIGSKVITLVDASKIIIPIDYDSLEAQNVIQVNFVAKTVKEAEAVRGESAVVQHDSEKDVVEKVQSATVTVNSNNVALEPGKELRIEASVNTYGQNATYQWYKDGVALQGQTGTTLVIANVTAADSGRYTLRVTTMSGTTQITSEVAVDVDVAQAPVDPAEDDGGFTEMQKIILISVAAGLVGLFVLLTIISIVVSVSRKKRYKK